MFLGGTKKLKNRSFGRSMNISKVTATEGLDFSPFEENITNKIICILRCHLLKNYIWKLLEYRQCMTIEYNIPLKLGYKFITEESKYCFSFALGYAGMLSPKMFVQNILVFKNSCWYMTKNIKI